MPETMEASEIYAMAERRRSMHLKAALLCLMIGYELLISQPAKTMYHQQIVLIQTMRDQHMDVSYNPGDDEDEEEEEEQHDNLLRLGSLIALLEEEAIPFRDRQFSLARYAFSELRLMEQWQFKQRYGWDMYEFDTIYPHLRMDETLRTSEGDVIDSRIALLITLAYLSAGRFDELEVVFGRSASALCRIKITTVDYLLLHWSSSCKNSSSELDIARSNERLESLLSVNRSQDHARGKVLYHG